MLHVSNIELYSLFSTTPEDNLCNANNKRISSSSEVSIIFVPLLTQKSLSWQILVKVSSTKFSEKLSG